jgi:succinoglycan biosynthesis protein ExoA
MSVAVVVPLRDGAHLVRDCVATILAQTRPPEAVSIVVAPSSDASLEIARSLADEVVTVLENPSGDRGSAINTALRHTRVDFVAMVDAQARLERTYLEAALEVLEDPTVAVAGGPMRPVGRGAIGEAMAAALQSPFGVGDSQFHFAGEARDVDSVYLGVYRRALFESVGRYNPALLRTEDDDLNARIREAGMRIRLDPSIRSEYRCRESIDAIWRQYHGYGYWKVALATLRPSAIRLRHLVPAAFVVALLIGAVACVAGWWLPLAVVVGAWALAAAVFAVLAPATSASARLLFPVVAFVMHVAYGLGSLHGLSSWPRLARRVREAAKGVG